MVKRLARTGLLACAAVLLSACTVVDLDANGLPLIPKDPAAKDSFSNQTPQQVAEGHWDSRVMAGAQDRALSWADMKMKSTTLKAGTSEGVFVRAGGKVTAVSATDQRERILSVTINGENVPVSIGPVIRSNAIRDAAGFRFEEFTNQVQFAQLTKALNRHAVQQLPKVDESWVGKNVQLVLAVSLLPGQVQDAVALNLQQEQP